MPTTCYPSRAGGFPPASFRDFSDALTYSRQFSRGTCGIMFCPAWSFFIHWSEVENKR